MKALKALFAVISVILAIAAIAAAVYVFRDKIEEYIETAKDRIRECPCRKKYSSEEMSDFADI